MSNENYPKNFPPELMTPPPATLSPSPLPKNFTPEMANTPIPSAANVGPRPERPQPEVTRLEIAEFFAARIVAQCEGSKGGSTRPRLFTLTFPYPDFERDVAIAFAKLIGAELVMGPSPELLEPTQPIVTLGAGSAGPMVLERFVHTMNHGFDVYVWCPRPWMLDRAVQDLVDASISVPRFDHTGFLAACVDFYELNEAPHLVPGDLDWIGNVIPRDFLINSQAVGTDIVPSLRRTVERRMARYLAEDWRVVDDLSGMDEARQWANGLVDEIRQARNGRMAWSDVESRVVLAGRRGIGKSSLARAIARTTGLRFVSTSVLRWQPTEEGPGAGIVQMHADFEEALAAAPAVLYIEDIDLFSIPPFSALVAPFLQYLAETQPADRVLLLGGVQDPENLSFALTGRGGLEATVSLSVPNSHALAQMYRRLLGDVHHSLTDTDFDAIGRLSLGLVGQEVDLMVRRARRRALKEDQRAVTAQDLSQVLLDEQVGSQAEGRRRLLAADELENTAYHEAGHAVLELMRSRGPGVLYATIVPRSNGSLGFVVPGIDETRPSMTFQDGIERLRVMLAGRAAEEVYGGPNKITNGCESDLASAAEHLRYLLTRSGFNGLLSYNQRFERSPELRAQAEEMLQREYAHVVSELRTHRRLLDRIAQLLLERQELSGEELARIHQAYRAELSSPLA